MSLVLAFSRRPDASLRDIVRTGAVDLLQLPDRRQGARRGRRARPSSSAGAAPAAAATASAAPAAAGGRRRRPAARPPCSRSPRPPAAAARPSTPPTSPTSSPATPASGSCIVDLDLQFGEVSTALRLRPKYTIFDALQREDTDEADLRAHIEEYCVQHETGVHVLAAPREPSEADRINPPDVTRILEAVRKHVRLRHRRHAAAARRDRPGRLRPVRHALRDGHARPAERPQHERVPRARSSASRCPTDNVRLILNKAESDVGIDIEQVTKLFPQGFESVLPYAKEVSRSINLGHAGDGGLAPAPRSAA